MTLPATGYGIALDKDTFEVLRDGAAAYRKDSQPGRSRAAADRGPRDADRPGGEFECAPWLQRLAAR
jgi:hypothetical protein